MSKPTSPPELSPEEHQLAQQQARMAVASILRGMSNPGYDLEFQMVILRIVAGEDRGQEQPETPYQAHVMELAHELAGGLATALGAQFTS
jgi:hypothetical protein